LKIKNGGEKSQGIREILKCAKTRCGEVISPVKTFPRKGTLGAKGKRSVLA